MEKEPLASPKIFSPRPQLSAWQRKEASLLVFCNQICGYIYVFVAGLLFTISSFGIQQLRLDPSDCFSVRCTIQFVICSLIIGISKLCKHKKKETDSIKGLSPDQSPDVSIDIESQASMDSTKEWTSLVFGLMTLQSLFGTIMVWASFACLQFLYLGDALALMFTAPGFTVILGVIFCKRTDGILHKTVFILLLLIGCVLTIKPGAIFGEEPALAGEEVTVKIDPSKVWYGVAIAFAYAITNAGNNLISSGPLKSVDPVLSCAMVGLVGIPFSIITSLIFEDDFVIFRLTSMSGLVLLQMTVLALLGISGYFLLICGLRSSDATLVSVIRSWEVLLGFALDVVAGTMQMDLIVMIGALMIVCSVLCIAGGKRLCGKTSLPAWF